MSDSRQSDFPNYMQVPKRIPDMVWHILRVISTMIFVLVCILLFVKESWGLWIFWAVLVPVAPLVFFLAPGLWRNICPLVSSNQIPREWKWTRALTAPKWLYEYGYLAQMIMLYTIIPARKFVFDTNGAALACLMIAFVISAFIGGMFLKGKSGWCSTLCPLLPLQKIYGQTPFIQIRNYHCRPCVGCVENCYDFNPEVAYVAELNAKNKYLAYYKAFMVASLPGLIYGYFTVPAYPHLSLAGIYLGFLNAIITSCFIFYFLKTFSKLTTTKITAIYAAASFNLFYWYSLPVTLHKYHQQLGWHIPSYLHYILYSFILMLTMVWLVRTFKKQENIFNFVNANQGISTVKVKNIEKISKLQQLKNLFVVFLKPNHRGLQAKKGQSLLSLLEDNAVHIQAGCRMGLCGADPVTILDGAEYIPPPNENEKNTLERFGFSKNCRMACSVKVTNNITISLQAEEDADRHNLAKTYTWVDKSIKKIVIIGNGIAGMTAAESIKSYHPECEIIVISREKYHLYNRISIPRLITDESSLAELNLLRTNWFANPSAFCWVNTLVTDLDLEKKEVKLGTNKSIEYDKLILAMGGKTYIPQIKNLQLDGVYAMREADDAMGIRAFIQQHNSKHQVVLGGGLLGVETAYSLHKTSLHPTIVHREDRLLNKQLDETASGYLAEYLESLGIKIIYEKEIIELNGARKVESAVLNDSLELPCDLLIICSGMVANMELACKAGLAVSRGILVDAHMRTSHPDVYAIGDVAEINNGRVEGLWITAVKEAEAASINVLGGDASYHGTIPSTILKISGIDIASIGTVEATSDADIVITHDDPVNKRYKKLIISNGKIIGAILVGYPDEAAYFNESIVSKRDVSQHIEVFRANKI